ncbi:MAG: thiamine monophosphate synthase [Alphaproteobacteria bacterium]|nr:thiamine monophosphate synthase [Alphaproteobacteria bacterium]
MRARTSSRAALIVRSSCSSMVPLQQQPAGAGKARQRDSVSARRKLLAAARRLPPRYTRTGARLPPVFLMSDPDRTPDLPELVAALPRGWGVIYRHFGADDRFETGARLARICRRRRLTLLVSADPDLALRTGADGVHWPETRLHLRRPRLFGARRIIETAAVHSRSALRRAAQAGVDAAIVSTVFESGSPSASVPIGPERFRRLARTAPLPVFALGGITANNAGRLVMQTHGRFAGWAAVGSIADAWA